ncbi:hypothetical protein ACSBOX_21430 (plasmid) [Arthrobacter sp. KN11-1C]|uniref:hypothetical protein n=1 Tax=Arthrobacter sp. KN11-1C TaxID=3445774 RepID=UPI003F9F7D4D
MQRTDLIGDLVGGAVNNAVQDAWVGLAGKLYEGVVTALQWLSSWWLNIPAPSLMNAGGDSPAQKVMLYTRVLIGVVGMLSTAFVVVQYAMRKNNNNGEQLAWAIGRTVVFSGLTLSVVGLLLAFGDLSAPWFVTMIGGETDFNKSLFTLSGDQKAVMGMLTSNNGGQSVVIILIIVFLIALVGSLMNFFFMIFSYGMLPIVAGMIPVLAAGSVTERGAAAFYKVIGWTLATCLFKPIAGIIYGGGIAMVKLLTSTDGAKLGADQLALQTMAGFMVIGAAGLVLPALIRLVVPTMAAASRGVGAGALVMAGMTAATGAIMGGASLMGKIGGSQAQNLARGGRMGAPAMATAGTGGGSLGGPAPAPVNRGLVNPARHGYPAPPQPKPLSPPQAPPIPKQELGGVNGGGQARPAAPVPRPASVQPGHGSGRRRMDAAKNHLSQHVYRVEEAIEGGEA